MSAPMDNARCLAFVPRGTSVAISRIPFGGMRAVCAERGLAEGDQVRCVGSLPEHVLLRGVKGELILLEKRLALAIDVEPVGG